jgi:lipopolysaccharide biosynthesis protein
MRLRPIAIYLPQFHPIQENDEWWGKGFTEWNNVTKAKPRFKSHYQPRLPADLGFYDLRVPEIREQQVSLAKENGIYGFCYYHYWFNGKRILNRPLDEIIESGKPDFPFCVSWANENWTRSWDGQSGQILLQQNYSIEDDIEHMTFLCRNLFKDKRYIKVDGKPLFIVYRVFNLPDPLKTAEIWRQIARKEGIGELYLCATESMAQKIDPNTIGFDASIEFQPDFSKLPKRHYGSNWDRLLSKFSIKSNPFVHDRVHFYEDFVKENLNKTTEQYKLYPGIVPSWDNSARRSKDALIFHESTPEVYAKWLDNICKTFKPYSKDENFIFINAWNEWAEGNHLEPCQKWGKAYLEKTKEVLNKYQL